MKIKDAVEEGSVSLMLKVFVGAVRGGMVKK